MDDERRYNLLYKKSRDGVVYSVTDVLYGNNTVGNILQMAAVMSEMFMGVDIGELRVKQQGSGKKIVTHVLFAVECEDIHPSFESIDPES